MSYYVLRLRQMFEWIFYVSFFNRVLFMFFLDEKVDKEKELDDDDVEIVFDIR